MNLRCEFEIPGAPLGFIAGWDKKSWAKRRQYMVWTKGIRTIAMAAGWRFPAATRAEPLAIHTRAFFRNGVHPDPENVHKAVADALMYKLKCADKYTSGGYASPLYDKENPRTEVVIDDARLPLRQTIPESW